MTERVITEKDYWQMALRLHQELRALRDHAKTLAVSDMERWRLSLRAGEIGKEIQSLAEKFRGDER